MENSTNIKLDASQLPTLRCINCGNYTFEASYVIKKVSALVSPTGKETVAPIQVFTCTSCASILPVGDNNMDFLSDVREEQAKNEDTNNEPKSNLIV